jgi:hypothetical protein
MPARAHGLRNSRPRWISIDTGNDATSQFQRTSIDFTMGFHGKMVRTRVAESKSTVVRSGAWQQQG